mmetsp:Transcript_107455/g.210646  ORF Transcript_107455/g.210646 Transcript_107455/m.210646 type:complete len:230 (+) Transcript_107455:1600-2289(+)
MERPIVHLGLPVLLADIEFAEAEALGEAPFHRLPQQRGHVRSRFLFDGAAALDVGAALEDRLGGFLPRRHVLVAQPSVLDRAAVRDGGAGEAPLAARLVVVEFAVRSTRDAVHRVVGRHHAHGALLGAPLEHREVRVGQVLLRDLGVEIVAVRVLRWVGPAAGALQRVGSEVLAGGARHGHGVWAPGSLDPCDPSRGILGVQVRVLAGNLLTATPARVQEDVEVRLREQ